MQIDTAEILSYINERLEILETEEKTISSNDNLSAVQKALQSSANRGQQIALLRMKIALNDMVEAHSVKLAPGELDPRD